MKPHPFYVSLIIGDKLVHNCMRDSGASNFIMPRCIADLLGIKYESMVRDVIQLDGSYVKIVGILKNVEMALYPFPNCTITQDILVAEVDLYFSIYLSRDLTTQRGGHIVVDWSYIIFRTRYGKMLL